MKTSKIKFAALTTIGLIGMLGLSACEGAKQELGLTRQAPDEFAVVKRAPLAMPPEYTLRPPQPGAPRPQETGNTDNARTVVFGDQRRTVQNTPDNAEGALLQKAGADIVEPNIRERVDLETMQLAPKDKPVAERLLGIGFGKKDQAAATVVDAKAETERLQKNKDEGKPVTEGETPTVTQ